MKTIRRMLPFAVVTSAVLALVAVNNGYTQEDAATSEDNQAQNEDARRPARGRLPNHYGDLGLSDEQKEKIYDIQRSYRARLVELQQQIEDLQQQQTLEIQETLTPAQKEALVKALKDAAERRAAKKTKKAKVSENNN
jgi:TolA-binding protein